MYRNEISLRLSYDEYMLVAGILDKHTTVKYDDWPSNAVTIIDDTESLDTIESLITDANKKG